MSVMEELGTQLQTAGHGTLGTNLFLNALPDEPDTASAIVEYTGEPPARAYGDVVVHETPRFQLIVRAADHATARNKIRDMWLALDALSNTTLSGTAYFSVEAITSPFLLRQDESGRWMFVANFRVLKSTS